MAILFACGAECGGPNEASSSSGHWNGQAGIANITVDTGVVRPGGSAASYKIVTSATSGRLRAPSTAATRHWVGRWYVRRASGSMNFMSTGGANGQLYYDSGTGNFAARAGSGTVRQGPTCAVDTWYRIDVHWDTSTGTATLQWKIDGTAQTDATDTVAAADISNVEVGQVTNTTGTSYLDDFICGDAAADYPFGPGIVVGYVANRDGTHSFTVGDFKDEGGTNIAVAATTANTRVDETPANTTDYNAQTTVRTTGYLEFGFTPTTAAVGAGSLRAVVPVAATFSSSGVAHTQKLVLNDQGTLTDIYALKATGGLTLQNQSGTLLTSARTSAAFTKADLDALLVRWGYSDDVAPNPRLSRLALEVEYSGTARVSQVAAEVLVAPDTQRVRASQVAAEVLVAPTTANARASQVAAEVLVAPTTQRLRATQVLIEVLYAQTFTTFGLNARLKGASHKGGGKATGTTTITLSLPAGVAEGDVLIAVLTDNAGSGTSISSVPSGWSAIGTRQNSTTVLGQEVYRYTVPASAPSTFAWTYTGTPSLSGVIDAYVNVGVTDVSAKQVNASSANIVAPTITTTVANTMLVFCGSTASATTITPPSGMTEDAVGGEQLVTGASSEISFSTPTATGATGTRTATSGAAVNIGTLLALQPFAIERFEASLDAVIQKEQVPGGFGLDATIMPAFGLDAVIKATQSGSFGLDAALVVTQTGSGTLDAIVLKTQSGSFSLDATVLKTASASFGLDAELKIAEILFSLDAVLRAIRSGSVALDAVVRSVIDGSFGADATIQKTQTADVALDATILRSRTDGFDLEAILLSPQNSSFGAEAVVLRTQSTDVGLDATFLETQTTDVALDALLLLPHSGSASLDAILFQTQTSALGLDSVVLQTQTGSFGLSAYLLLVVEVAAQLDAVLLKTQSANPALNAVILKTQNASAALDATFLKTQTGSFALDFLLLKVTFGSVGLQAITLKTQLGSLGIASWISDLHPNAIDATFSDPAIIESTLNMASVAATLSSEPVAASLTGLVINGTLSSTALGFSLIGERTYTFGMSAVIA